MLGFTICLQGEDRQNKPIRYRIRVRQSDSSHDQARKYNQRTKENEDTNIIVAEVQGTEFPVGIFKFQSVAGLIFVGGLRCLGQ